MPPLQWYVQPCSVLGECTESFEERCARQREMKRGRPEGVSAGEGLVEGLEWLVPMLNAQPGLYDLQDSQYDDASLPHV